MVRWSFTAAIITCIVNTLTCLTAGVLVFAILGHMAHINNMPIESVVRLHRKIILLTIELIEFLFQIWSWLGLLDLS